MMVIWPGLTSLMMTGAGFALQPAQTLERELTEAMALVRPQLPIVAHGVTIDDVQVRGTEIIYHMKLPVDADEQGFQRFRDQLPIQACGNPQTRGLIDRGAAFTYNVEDSAGERFTASVRSCAGMPPAAASSSPS